MTVLVFSLRNENARKRHHILTLPCQMQGPFCFASTNMAGAGADVLPNSCSFIDVN